MLSMSDRLYSHTQIQCTLGLFNKNAIILWSLGFEYMFKHRDDPQELYIKHILSIICSFTYFYTVRLQLQMC